MDTEEGVCSTSRMEMPIRSKLEVAENELHDLKEELHDLKEDYMRVCDEKKS